MKNGAAGLLAAIGVAVLSLLASFWPLTVPVLAVLLPVIWVGLGAIPALLACGMSLALCSSVLGMETALLIGLRGAVSGLLLGYVMDRPIAFGKRILAACVIQTVFALVTLLVAFRGGMPKREPGPDARALLLWGDMLFGYIDPAGLNDILTHMGNGWTAECAWYYEDAIRTALPAGIVVSTALSSLLSVWWPVSISAARGETEKDQYLPPDKWYVSNSWIVAIMACTAPMLLVSENAAFAAASLGSFVLSVQGCASLARRLKKRDWRRGPRTAFICALYIFVSIVPETVGLYETVLGKKGILQNWMRHNQERGE